MSKRGFLASPEGVERLRAAKAELGLSFAAIAERAGMSADTVSRLFHPERGKRVGRSSVEAIARVLGVELGAIVPDGEWTEADEAEGFAEAKRRIRQAISDGATKLDLSELELTALPKELGQLSNLSGLSLSQNQLTALPKELGQLSNLSGLDLSQNQLTALPKELGQLSNLSRAFPRPKIN